MSPVVSFLISYPFIALPPLLLGALQVNATDPGEATADTGVGAAGDVIGVALIAVDAAVAFSLSREVTVTEYEVPPVNPETTVE